MLMPVCSADSVKVSSSSDTTSSHLQSSFASSFLNKLEDKVNIHYSFQTY